MSKGYRGFWRLNRRKNGKARKSRVQPPLQLGHEALEGKRLLAFAPLPAPPAVLPGGDMSGAAISLSSDGSDSLHELTIILDDQTNPGFVTATITTFDATTGLQTGQFFNFSGISYKAFNDTNGSVTNNVSLWTSYEADLVGRETSPADDAAVGLSTNWQVNSQFPAGLLPGTTVLVNLFNADSLTVNSGVLGGGTSTIAGEFESPTLPPDLDATTGANITLNSGTGIDDGGLANPDPIAAYTLILRSQTGNVDLDADVFTTGALSMTASQDISLGGIVKVNDAAVSLSSTAGRVTVLDVVAADGIEVSATGSVTLNGLLQAASGDIDVTTKSGQIVLQGAEIHALGGEIALRALKEGIVQRAAVTPRWEEYIVAETGVTISAGGEVVLIGAVRSNTADIVISSTDRDVNASAVNALIHALAGSVSISAAGPVAIRNLYADVDVGIKASQSVIITGLIQAIAGDVTISSVSGDVSVTGAGKVHALDGAVTLTSKRGAAILQDVFAHTNLTVDALGDVSLNRAIQSTVADVIVESDGNINNGARILTGGSINLTADLSVTSLGGGIVRLDLLSGGVNYDYAIVTIAAPAAGGGRAALARATINGGTITDLTIVEPGYGYAPNERVQVIIEGNPEQRDQLGNIVRPAASGATAAAFSGSALSSLSAGDSVAIAAGTAIDVTNEIRAREGAVDLSVAGGTLDVSDIFADGDIRLAAAQTIQIAGLLRSDAGDVSVGSAGGGIDLRGTILAPGGGADVTAAGQIVQRGGSVSRDKIFLLSGGRQYTYALVVVDPPPGAGETALAQAVITYYDPLDLEAGGYISDIILLDGGWGYPSDSRVNVRIQGDGEGAAAVFATDLVSSSIDVRDSVQMLGGDSITLVSAVRSSAGDVSIRNTLGDVSVQSVTAGQNAEVISERGKVTLVSVSSGDNATIAAFRGVTVTDSVNAVEGDISISTLNGDLSFVQAFDFGDNYLVDDAATVLLPRAVIASERGAISLSSANGSIVTPYVANAAKNVSITSFGALELANDITSTGGDIVATSTSGLVRLRSNIAADGGSIIIDAQTQLQQEAVSGISKIELLSPGPMLDVPPDVTVTIAGPREGGEAARAIAVIERRALNDGRDDDDNANNEDIIAYEYFIGAIAIVNPGRGYAVGEQPVVTITGVAGAEARAYGPTMVAMLTAQNDISLSAGENITLLTKVHAVDGNIVVTSKAGDLDLSSDSLLVSAAAGTITLIADRGSAEINRMAGGGAVVVTTLEELIVENGIQSDGSITLTSRNRSADVRHLNAKDDIGVLSFGTATVAGEVASQQGAVNIASSSGGIFLDANVVAEQGAITLAPQTFLLQRDGTGIERVDVLKGGSVLNVFPNVTVTIAPPSAPGGQPATAEAVIDERVTGGGATDQEIEYYVSAIRITNPGRGYELGENPIVTISGIEGASAVGVGPQNVRNVWARGNVSIAAGHDVTLRYKVTSAAGDITVASTSGRIDGGDSSALLHAVEGSVSVSSVVDAVAVNVIKAGSDATLSGHAGVTSNTSISVGGRIDASTVIGNVAVRGDVYAATGDVDISSVSGSVSLAANIHAHDAGITVRAHGGVFQRAGSGVQRIEVLYGGESEGDEPPALTIGIDPPKGGGIAARAFARLRAFTNAIGETRYTIDEIVITDPGRGYEIGEAPEVSIDGIDGAAAVAVGPEGYQDIVAAGDIVIAAGETVVLTNPLRSVAGSISISSVDGALNLGAQDQVVHAEAGAVTLDASVGRVDANRIYANGDAVVRGGELVSLVKEVVSKSGDISATSTAGSVLVAANVMAANGAVQLSANHQIRQTSQSGISRVEVVTSGQFVGGQNAPTVTVTIAPPSGGGAPAEAVAISVVAGFTNEREARPIWSVQSILITNPGSGYAIGERPLVTISGIPGALAVATGPSGMQSIVAESDVIVTAGDDIFLVDTIRSISADVSVSSIAGSIHLGTPGLVLHATKGAVTVAAEQGAVELYRAYADTEITIRGGQAVSLVEEIVAINGDIAAASVSGSMFITANVHSVAGAVSLSSHQSLVQTRSTGVRRVDVVAPGSFTGLAAPAVTVTIAPPLGVGRQAIAQAVVNPTGANARGETVWGVTEVIITDPGSGYAVGERPLVTIAGVTGAIAVAFGPDGNDAIVGQRDVSLAAGSDVSISTVVRSNGGDVLIASVDGNVDLSEPGQLVHAMGGSITVTSRAGTASVQQLAANADVSVTAHGHVTIHDSVDSKAGNVTITSSVGNVDFTPPGALVFAGAGGVSLTSTSRSILNTPTLNVGGDINITSFNSVDLKNEITSRGGDITVRSTSGSINLGGNLHSHNDSVTLVAKAAIVQQATVNVGYGIVAVTMLSGGLSYDTATIVTIAPPSAGGTAARGRAIINEDGVITGVQILTPGVGYAVGEEVEVTFTGGAGTGASAFAVAGTTTQNILAGDDVTLLAGTGVKILNAVNATNGDIEIRTINGNLDFTSTEAILSAENGDVTLSSFNGSILSPPVLHVKGDIVMEAFTAIPVQNQLTSDNGSIRVASSSGSVALNANVFAADRVELIAKTGISQPNGFIQGDSLVVRNGSNTAVNLGNTFNNVNQLAATTLGSFSYTDADDFETGVNRGAPVGIELRADALSLTALAPLSTIRIVSGLQYRSLSISAGAAFGSNVGTVEYVVTSGGDSAAPNAAFQGSLRDMTRYLNDNTATYLLNGARLPQKSAIVFDEDGYLVEEIVVAGALPAMMKPVRFDGGRLEQTATVDRIGLRGTATAPTGLNFGLGSSGSTLTKTAAYGFTNGSAIVMASGNNTVTDVHVGMDATGTVRANRVGLDIAGTTAVNNLIGSTTFDAGTVNRFAGNTLAGVLIRGGASANRVFGNIIGDESGSAPERGNGDGIRIVRSTGNLIGAPEEVRPDLVASVSNQIMGNRAYGIQVTSSIAGTFATANRIRNNYIAANAIGVGINASKFAVLGGSTEESANTIVNQTGSGVEVSGSSNVRLTGNYIGITPAGDTAAETAAGNGGAGVFVGNASQAVEITGGNRIGANSGHGVAIASGATGVVLTGNTIGGTLDDGTPAGNALDGVAISSAIGNSVGAGNLVSRNGRHGVSIADAMAGSLAAGNRVIGSTVTDNVGSGVFLSGARFSTIGDAGSANRITANRGSGIRLESSVATGAATGNLIQGNIIGTDGNRSVNATDGNLGSGISIENGVGNVIANGNVIMNNRAHGVELLGGSNNLVGGAAAGQGNTISHNAINGVRVAAATGVASTSTTATGHVITGNTIANNARNGVMVGSGTGITVGHSVTATQATGAGNAIFGNLNHGVVVGAAAQQVAVQGNGIYGNALGAISRLNGANRSATQTLSLNTATVQQAGTASQPITITGQLSNPSYRQQQYSVDLYASNPEDGNYGALTGYQARRFLGRATVTTDVAGKATFTIRITTPIRVGEVITANATALRFEAGSSSAESNAVVVALQNIPVPGTPAPTPTPTPAPRPTPGRPAPRPAPRRR